MKDAKTRYQERRRANLPADLKCPLCSELIMELHRWVVKAMLDMGMKPCCRKCYLNDRHLQ